MASNTNGFRGGMGRARGRARARGVDLSAPAAQVRMPRSAPPTPQASAHSAPPGLQQQQPARPQVPQQQQSAHPPQAQQAPSQAQVETRGPPDLRPFGGVTALQKGVSKMTVNGRGAGDTRPPRRPLMDAQLYGDESNEGYLLDPTMGRRGTLGTPVPLVTNYVELADLPNATYHQHSLHFSPELDDVRTMRYLVYQLSEHLSDGKILCDGGNLFTWKSIGNEDEKKVMRATSKDGTEYVITITHVAARTTTDPQTVQVLGRMLRRCTGLVGLKEMGKNGASFDMNEHSLYRFQAGGHRLEIAPGYITSVRRYESAMLMNIYSLHKVFRKEKVSEVMARIWNSVPKNQVHDKMLEELVGCIIITRYNDKTYRIDDVAFNLNPNCPWNDEQETYAQYYKRRYGMTIQNPTQPLLVSRLKDKDRRRGNTGVIHLIPEVCEMTGLTDRMRAEFHTMRAIAERTRMNPTQRVNSIRNLMRTLVNSDEVKGELNKFQVRFRPGLYPVEARQLSAPQIIVAKEAAIPNKNGDWSGGMKKSVLVPKSLVNWVVLYRKADAEVADECVRTIGTVCAGMGIRYARPRMVALPDGMPGTYHNTLLNNMNPEYSMVLCIVPDDRPDRYNSIKRITCVDNAMPSQVVKVNTLKKKQGAGGSMMMSVCTKLTMQMNCKMGGALWRVKIPLQDTIIMGYDTFHDTVNKKRSVGALVSSIDPTFTSYGSFVSFHENGEEMSNHISVGVRKILSDHGMRNGQKWIKRLILYRDGVGEGQVSFVVKHETAALINTVKEFDPAIKVAVVIVSKRIHSQFYQKGAKEGEYTNPGPGTVIDSGVTNPNRHDFFLIPQSVRQGTVNPVNFNVCVNTGVNLDMGQFQTITYMLCHLYYNWPGTVRVPAPVQYAHKLAFLVGQSLHRTPNQGLGRLLYFL